MSYEYLKSTHGSQDPLICRGNDSLTEIKCTTSEKSMQYYIKGGQLTKKADAQVQLQMYLGMPNPAMLFFGGRQPLQRKWKSNNNCS